MKPSSLFRCTECGHTGPLTQDEVASHRALCPTGPTEPLNLDDDTPARMYISLRILRAWNNGTEVFHGFVAFAEAVQQKGAMPCDGIVTDTKIALQAIMPEVYQPVPGEVVAYGISLENSDFGAGPVSVRAYPLRIWCTNMAITSETMRQVHLGARLDRSTFYSPQT